MIRLIIRLFLILIVISLLIACDQSTRLQPEDPEAANTLRFDVYTPFSSLNPTDTQAAGAVFIFPLLFDYLGLYNPADGTISPSLARSWQYDPSALTWHVILRDNAFFSDGQNVVAKDVRFSIETVIAGVNPEVFQTICRMETPATYSLKIVLKKNDPVFFQKLMSMEILPHYISLENHKLHPIGSGPYRLLKPLEENSVLILQAVKNFYKGTPQIDQVIFRYVPDAETSWTRLVNGKTDISYQISPSNYAMMKYLSDRYRISAIHSPYTWIIAYNTSDPLFTDPRVRHALSCCIDRGYLIKHLLTGYGEPVSSPFGANSPFGRPGKKEAPFDPEKGRQLLEAAGWQKNRGDGLYYKNGRPFEFTLLYPNENPVEQAVATHLKLSLYDMGIRVILKPASFKSLSAVYHYQNDYQAVLTVYKRVYHYSSSPLFSWLPTETGKVYMGNFQSPDLTARLQCLAACKDRECEISTCREIEDLLIDLQPITPLYSKKEITLISSRIALPYEFSPNYTAIHRLYEAKIIPEK